MVLTDTELKSIGASIEATTGWDKELLQRCSHLIHIGAHTAAVQAAFNLLEEKLRGAVDKAGMSGVQLTNHAFGQNGPLTLRAIQLGYPEVQREGLRELFASAFKLFRNPAAHGATDFNGAEAKSIIGLVSLMLDMLVDIAEHKNTILPKNVENALANIQGTMGQSATNRLHAFLVACAESGIVPQPDAKNWLPFKRNVRIMSSGRWPKPKIHPVTMFYLKEKGAQLRFPMNHYRKVKGFSFGQLQKELTSLGFQVTGKNQDYEVELLSHNDQSFFDRLLELSLRKARELDLA